MRFNAICCLFIVHAGLLAAGCSSRSAESVICIPQIQGIEIDGHDSDWADQGFRVNAMALANGVPLTASLVCPRFRLAWNDQGLLLLLSGGKPKDAPTNGDDAKANESVEVLVGRPGSIDRYLVTVTPFLSGKESLWSATDLRQLMVDRRRPLIATVAVTTSADRYVVEALLPWKNLSMSPEPGKEVLIQIRVNHRVGGSQREQFRWNPGSGNNVIAMNSIRLAAGDGSSPVEAAMASRYERLRRIRLNVVSTSEFAGKTVDVMDGERMVASGMLSQTGLNSHVPLVLPMPPIGKPYGVLSAHIAGRTAAQIQLPDADTLRDDAIANATMVFKPFVFSGDHFPQCEFEDSLLIDELFGPYTLRTTYYDAGFNPVKQPKTAGRYGAVVEVRSEQGGRSFKRYCTLYRQDEPIDWSRIKLPATSPETHRILHDVFSRDSATAILLAGLSEIASDALGEVTRTDVEHRDEEWWYRLKQKTGDVEPFKYLAYLPKEYEQDVNRRWPLILFLHGAGERGNDLDLLKTWGIPLVCEKGGNTGFVAICPQCPPRGSWMAMALNDLLDEVMKKYRIDPDRVYVTGASMGGNGSWRFAQRYPDRVAAIAPVCGGGDPNDVARVKDLPVWIFHGEKDPAVPFAHEQAMIDALDKLDGRLRLTFYPGIGHECWNAAYATPELIPWLLQQRRGHPSQPAAKSPEVIAP